MFNWTTTTIINSLKDYSTGLPLIKVWNGAETKDALGKDFTEDPKSASMSGKAPVVRIKRDHTFEGRWIRKAYKAVGHGYQVCEMDVKVDDLITAISDIYAEENGNFNVNARLSFYVALEGSEESIYANDWYQKGKPFSIGFSVSNGESAEKVAKRIKRNAEKHGVVNYGKKVFDLSVESGDEGTVLKLKGTHEYQRFAMAAVAVDEMIDERVIAFYGDNDPENEDQTVFELKARGVNGFGTYHQLVKDLRLPTAHHNKWLQIKEDEKPVVGGVYNQYIITYCAPSMANPGFTVVGQHNMSVTTHVFWVLQDIADKFEDALADVIAKNEWEVAVQVTETPADEEAGTEATLEIEGPESSAAVDAIVNHEQEIEDTKD